MSDKAWGKLWGYLGLAALIYGWAAAARSRGLAIKSDVVDVGSELPIASSILSFVVLWALVVLSLCVTLRYQRNHRGESWQRRIPLAFFAREDVDVDSPDGRLYQRMFLAAFVVAPSFFLLFVFVQFAQAPVYCGTAEYARGVDQFLPPPPPAGCLGDYRFGHKDGPSYFPWTQPWLYLLGLLYALWLFARVSYGLLRRPDSAPTSAGVSSMDADGGASSG